MIQDKYNSLFIFEIKFSKNPIQKNIIAEVQEKISNLSLPNQVISYRPLLIHVNGVDPSIEKETYFTHILNFSDLLKDSSA